MFTGLIKRVSSISPRAKIFAVVIAAVALTAGAVFVMRGGLESGAEAKVEPRAARLDRVDGSVGIAHLATDVDEQELEWTEADVNTPVTVGDRLYARGDNANASIALSGHNYVRLNPGASLDLLSLEEERTQLALRTGSGLFDVGALGSDDLYEVATPYGAVDFVQPGLYEVNVGDGNTLISVLSGLAQVVGQGGSGYINKGEVLSLIGEAAAQALASRLDPGRAGGIVDDYYRYRHPRVYDGRYRNYDAYLDDPLYYDSYGNSLSSRYVTDDIPGVYELDSYGDWSDLDGYGHCWAPRVNDGWAPFRYGSWDMHQVWGPTWISQEPWGWAPYHYGRWAFVNQRWYWVPGELASRHSYCPAPVAFIPLRQTSQIAWVPLAPGEVYVPRYYDADFQPRYLASREVIREVSVQQTFVNLSVPSGVTVVPVRGLRRRIDPSMIVPVDAGLIADNRPAMDPFAIDSVRRIAARRGRVGSRMKLERVETEALNRPVIASVTPESFRARRELSRALKVEQVSESRKKNKLKIDQTGELVSGRQRVTPEGSSPQSALPANSTAREQMRAGLAARAEQGDKSARRELKQFRREERRQQAAGKEITPQSQIFRERVQPDQRSRQMKDQNRPQQMTDPSQRKLERKARQEERRQQKQPERKPPQAMLQQQQNLEQMRHEQVRQAKRQARVQRIQKQAGLPPQMAQQQEQFKAHRRIERQQRAMIEQRQQIPAVRVDQAREQMKAQKRIERQQRAAGDVQNRIPVMRVDQSAREAQVREQLKAQRRLEQQRSAPVNLPQRAPAYVNPAPAKEADQAARKAERMQRKGKGN